MSKESPSRNLDIERTETAKFLFVKTPLVFLLSTMNAALIYTLTSLPSESLDLVMNRPTFWGVTGFLGSATIPVGISFIRSLKDFYRPFFGRNALDSQEEAMAVSEVNHGPTNIGRRRLLETVKKVALVVGAYGLFSEVKKGIEGKLETPFATFYPYYEEHSVNVKINPNHPVDIHWTEYAYYDRNSKKDTSESQRSEAKRFLDSYGFGLTDYNRQNLLLLKSKEAKIAYGDIDSKIDPPHLEAMAKFLRPFPIQNPQGLEALEAPFKREAGMAAMAYTWARLGWFVGSILDRSHKSLISRRQFLRLPTITLDAAAGYMAANAFIGEVWSRTAMVEDKDFSTRALERVADRINALATHARPYDLLLFFRNLLWAYKVLDLAEIESKRLGRRVNISYQVGGAHAGLEDLLYLGKDLCLNLIRLYPDDILKELQMVNGENFDSTILLTPQGEGNGLSENDWNDNKLVHGDLLTS